MTQDKPAQRTAFRRHPDRFPGTWWPVATKPRRIGRAACPTCGTVMEFKPKASADADGHLRTMLFCDNQNCFWRGEVLILNWND